MSEVDSYVTNYTDCSFILYLSIRYILSEFTSKDNLRLSVMWLEFVENNAEDTEVFSQDKEVPTLNPTMKEVIIKFTVY